MAESIDKILDSIYKSEQESNVQYEYLQKLKNDIGATESKVKEAEKQRHYLTVEVERKMKRLANREVELLSLDVRNKCLQDRIKELKSENADLKKTKEELQTRLKLSRENLCKLSQEFMETQDFFKRKQPGFKERNYQNTTGVSDLKQDSGSLTNYDATDVNSSLQREETSIANLLLWDDFSDD